MVETEACGTSLHELPSTIIVDRNWSLSNVIIATEIRIAAGLPVDSYKTGEHATIYLFYRVIRISYTFDEK